MASDRRSPRLPPGWKRLKVRGLKAAFGEERHRQGVAHGQHGGGAGGGGQPQGAGLPGHPGVDGHLAALSQGGARPPGHGDERRLQALQAGDEDGELPGFAAVGQGQDHVLGRHHAQVAVHGLHRMEEQGRGAGGVEGGHDFPGHDAGFAHPGDDDPALGLIHQVHRLDEANVQLRNQGGQPLGFDGQNFPGQVEDVSSHLAVSVFHKNRLVAQASGL